MKYRLIAFSLLLPIVGVCGWFAVAWHSIGSQEDTAAFVAVLANQIVRPELQLAAEQVRCREPEFNSQRLAAVFRCSIPTSCNVDITRHVHSGLIQGKYLSADPLAYNFARTCSDMLLPQIATEQEQRIDQGG